MTEQPEQLMFHGREISMTTTEQAAMRHKLLAYTLMKPSHAKAVSTAFSWVRAHVALTSMLAVLLALGVTGVSASMAGPNDALYDLKVQVSNRVESAMTFDDEAQLDVELRQIERQFNAEELGAQEALADDSQGEVTETPKPQDLNSHFNEQQNLRAQLDFRKQADDIQEKDGVASESEHLDKNSHTRFGGQRDSEPTPTPRNRQQKSFEQADSED